MTIAERIERALRSVVFEDEMTPQVRDDRARIAARYCDLKRQHGFMESEATAKTEFIESVLAASYPGIPDR